jgi:hypothetical protein
MKYLEMGFTLRQSDLILDSLRLQLRENNDRINNLMLTRDELLELQSNNEVIRSTMLSIKDEIARAALYA